MAKLRTQKKFAKPQITDPETLLVIDATTQYLKYWTDRELSRHNSSICVPTKNGYRIGKYKLKVNKNHSCSLYSNSNEFIHTFENKVSAVLYTIYTIKQQYLTADTLLLLDKEINKNYTDILALTRGLDRAKRQKDFESVDIRRARIDVAKNQLSLARKRLSVLHGVAKFNKVWI